MIRALLRRQTLASFDYQWRELPEGGALLSDDWFLASVERILSEELICLRREWFAGRSVIDAGAGSGRWTVGLLKLGCRVLAVDFSADALARLRDNVARLCTEEEAARLETSTADLLELSDDLVRRRFDLVFSFGVLHHTGATARALRNVAQLAGDSGAVFVYLYGRESFSRRGDFLLRLQRLALAPLPFGVKRRLIGLIAPRGDVHQAFDALSPTINTRHTLAEVEAWFAELGFEDVAQTIPHSELFVRALRRRTPFEPYLLPPPSPPYWFERYAASATPTPASD